MAKITQDTGQTVGAIQQSMLTEAQIQAEYGTGWVLMDGRDVTGSSYATITGNTTLPVARGQVLRGKNNGRSDGQENPDGESALGLAQVDCIQGHEHTALSAATAGSYGYKFRNEGSTNFTQTLATNGITTGSNGTPRTGDETAPKNITINIFVKIN